MSVSLNPYFRYWSFGDFTYGRPEGRGEVSDGHVRIARSFALVGHHTSDHLVGHDTNAARLSLGASWVTIFPLSETAANVLATE